MHFFGSRGTGQLTVQQFSKYVLVLAIVAKVQLCDISEEGLTCVISKEAFIISLRWYMYHD